MSRAGRRWLLGSGIVLGAALLLQVVPVGYRPTNPPVRTELAWPDAETRDLFYRACGDCHSNETRWPWYSYVAPVRWVVTGHVRHGRGTLNVSDWSEERFGEEARESAATIRNGSMPPADYLRMHPAARLTDVESDRLIRGLVQMFGEGE